MEKDRDTTDIASVSQSAGEDGYMADVVQFLMPNGRRRYTSVELPCSTKQQHESLTKSGYWLEAEILTTGQVSVTISDGEKDIDISLTQNGPEVVSGIVEMLGRKLWESK